MKKRVLSLLLCTSLAISLAACGGGQQASTEQPANQEQAKEVVKDDKIIELDDLKLKVLETEVFEPGELKGTYMSNEKPAIIFTYELTVKREEPINAQVGWLAAANVTQETGSTIENLQWGITYDTEKYKPLFDMLQNDIKQGATVRAAAIYDIKYPGEPVKVTFTKGIGGKKLGEFIVDTSK